MSATSARETVQTAGLQGRLPIGRSGRPVGAVSEANSRETIQTAGLQGRLPVGRSCRPVGGLSAANCRETKKTGADETLQTDTLDIDFIA